MNLFYNENQFENKKNIIQQFIYTHDVNYIFILLPTLNKELKKEWKMLCYELGVDIIVLSFRQYIHHRNKNKLFSYKSYFNDYFSFIFDETLFIIDQFEYMNEPTSKIALLINKLVKDSSYNINFINSYCEGITSYYLINAFIIKNYYVNYTDFMSDQYIYYSEVENLSDLITLSDFKRNVLIYSNDEFQINKNYESYVKNKLILQQFLNIFMNK